MNIVNIPLSTMVDEGISILEIGKQLKETLQADVAIVDKYGFILSSSIKKFKVNDLISPTLLDFINGREKVEHELSSGEMNAFVISFTKENYVFSFGKAMFIMAKVPSDMNLKLLIPSLTKFSELFDKTKSVYKAKKFVHYTPQEEEERIEEDINALVMDNGDKFKVFKDIIRQVNQL